MNQNETELMNDAVGGQQTEDATVKVETGVMDDAESGVSFNDITDMVSSIEKLGQSMEAQRQMVDANKRMSELCYKLGISKNDQTWLREKFWSSNISEEQFNAIIKDKEKLDEEYFTRPDGTIITIDKEICDNVSMTEFDLKADFVETLQLFYNMERDTQKSINDINQSIEEFKIGEISEFSATIANNFKQSLTERLAEIEALDDEKEKRRRKKLIKRMESAYTFGEYVKILEKYPSIVKNTISELKDPVKVRDTGARYNRKRKQQNCASSLIAIIRDDIGSSLERQYMAPGDYVEGYENLFGYFLIRFFSKEDWSSKDSFTKEMHNATVIILTTLMSGSLDKDFREEIISNINKIWAVFKTAL